MLRLPRRLLPTIRLLLPLALVLFVSLGRAPVASAAWAEGDGPARREAARPATYRIAPGDTLHAVAARHGLSVAALIAANDLRGSRLVAGTELRLARSPAQANLAARPSLTTASIISRGAGTRSSVALTFDAGADRGYGELILNVLRDRGVRATFGMTGVWAQANPDLIARMADEGHRFINHSWDHRSFTGLSTRTRPLSRQERWQQLDWTESLLVELTGQSTLPFFRSPYGDVDATVQQDLAARGYAYNVLWTVDSGGWTGIPVRSIIDRCLRGARPGAIYVMHVGASAGDGLALAAVIDGLAAAGYDFETVDEIIWP